MAVCGSWILCVGALLASPVRSALYINDCSSGVRDVTEDTDVSFTCGQYTDQIEWSSFDGYGTKNYIGRCNDDGCTSLNGSPFFLREKEISKMKYESTLSIRNVTRHQDFSLRCNEGNITATCRLRVIVPVSIVPETCQVQLSGWKVYGVCTIQWLDTINDIPDCWWSFSYQSSPPTAPDDLKGLLSSSIFVTVGSVRYKRRSCSFEQDMPVIAGYYNYSISVSSHPDDQFSKVLLIVRPGQLTHNCLIPVYEGSSMSCKCMSSYVGSPPAEFLWDDVNNDTLHLHNIQRQDSGNTYTCRFRWGTISDTIFYNLMVITPVSNNPNSCSVQLSGWIVSGVCRVQWLPSEQERTCNWMLKTKEKSEKIPKVQSTSSYKTADHVSYMNCFFVRPMPVITGNYTYSIDASSHPADKFSKSFFIEKPDAPQHNCSKMLLEGSNVTCTCFTSNLGNPPAQIGWAESSKEHFFIEDIKRERNGTITTCSLTWGSIYNTTPYMILVAFGPSVAYISSSSEETSGDETKTELVCTASDVYPSAFFRWNILCENETKNETTSRCTLPTSPTADQTTIKCTASNQIFAQVSSTTIYVLKPTHNPYQGGVIAGSVVVVLLLLVIVAVIILFIKRRKVINKPETQTPTVHFAAPSGDIYTIAGTTTGDHREDEYVTVRDTTCPNNILQPQTPVVRFAAPSGDLYSIAGPATAREVNQATERMQHKLPCHQTENIIYHNNQGTESRKMPIKPKPTRLGEKSRQPWSSKAEFDNKLETQRPAAHFAAPSGDLYAIAGPATAGDNKHVTEATSNLSYAPKSSSGHQARDITNMTNKGMDSKKMAIKPKPTRFGKQSRQDVPVTGYMNVTQVPTDSGLGVYHVVPWAAKSETGSSDVRVHDTSKMSEDEYNVLRFQEDRTGEEDHAITYSHLNIK
ncbi:uncharacterized protein LOC112567843 isoform X2 [Pomacea canaliculata]|uniref:uncharacterized protein LOC112567843 isoform X2 n=1 Tax=Pomacea canaliculata TaxID=400727 RepID=UPI000D734BFC|nr:uncharacterized protein LOC112567843 isoform X2 [Pomacea canaliculata]